MLKSQYWKMTRNGGELTTEAFDASFIQFESFTEVVTGAGTTLKTYLSLDSKGDSLYHEIENREVVKWKENGPYEYSTKYENGNGVVFFTKQRQFLDTPMVHVLGRDYEALRFKGIYQFSREEDSVEYEYFQYSYYVEGIGMVKYERHYPDGDILTLELTRIYTEEEWNELRK